MYDKKQLRIGTKIEMEHASPRASKEYNRRKAERTAKEHLREHPSYYLILPGAERRMAAVDKQMAKRKRKRRW